jgi:cellulose biosynthesis protein BcsQ
MRKIVTFYSYKGGVGRTMALANIAVLLSQWEYKVLIIDWDLEAPGLEHFFKQYFKDFNEIQLKKGLTDILLSLSADDEDEKIRLAWKDKIIKIDISEPECSIDLITAGSRNKDYFNNVRTWDIEAFYTEKKGGFILEKLREQWQNEYDYIFIDSRTGVTDIGGVCTIQLPDIIVLFFSATEQSLYGTLDIARRIIDEHKRLPITRYRPLLLPIPSRLDTQEEFKEYKGWLERFEKELPPIYSNWLNANISIKRLLENTKIPYMPYFSYGEKLAVIEQGTTEPTGLGYAYANIAMLIANNLQKADQFLQNRNLFQLKFQLKGDDILSDLDLAELWLGDLTIT